MMSVFGDILIINCEADIWITGLSFWKVHQGSQEALWLCHMTSIISSYNDHHVGCDEVAEKIRISLDEALPIRRFIFLGPFLAFQNSSIGDLVPWSVALTPLTIRVFTTLQSDPRDLWPLRHLIRGMRRHYYLPANLPTYLHTYLPTYLPTYLH